VIVNEFYGILVEMPFYFQRSLYKMSKRFKRQKVDNNLFHHGLIKLIIIYHLSLHGDSWGSFIARNGFEDTDPVQVDKPMVTKAKAEPPVPFHILLPSPKPSTDPKVDLPDVVTKNVETIKRPVRKKSKANPTANAKGKRNAQLLTLT
jgi:hypothetical protein